MGAALASEALSRGFAVDVVTGPCPQEPPRGANIVHVNTTEEMLAACIALHPKCDILIGAAAVCDYRPAARLESKRVRDESPWTIELVPNPDILQKLARQKGDRLHIGFALETSGGAEAIVRARQKLVRKNLDWIVLNPSSTVGSEISSFHLIPRRGEPLSLGSLSKARLAARLFGRTLDPSAEFGSRAPDHRPKK